MPIPQFRDDGWLPTGHHPAGWEEIETTFGGDLLSGRSVLIAKLIAFRDGLRSCGCIGRMVLDGSFISSKQNPNDFDVLLLLQPDIQELKDADSRLSQLLDTEMSENQEGYSVFYAPINSSVIAFLLPMWDISKEGVVKGVVEVEI